MQELIFNSIYGGEKARNKRKRIQIIKKSTTKLLSVAKQYGVDIESISNGENGKNSSNISQFLIKFLEKQNIIAPIISNISAKRIIKGINKLGIGEGALILIHLWIGNPSKAEEVYSQLNNDQISILEDIIIFNDDFSDFHIGRNSIRFQLFIRWLAQKNRRIDIYYNQVYLANEEKNDIEKDIRNFEKVHQLSSPQNNYLLLDNNLFKGDQSKNNFENSI
jgi:hypothetical protein